MKTLRGLVGRMIGVVLLIGGVHFEPRDHGWNIIGAAFLGAFVAWLYIMFGKEKP